MHNNYYFLRQLVKKLEHQLVGKKLLTCFSQSKDELILGLSNSNHQEIYMKADLSSPFSCLSFSESFARAKRNSIDLFPEFINLEVVGLYQFSNERAFALIFSDDSKMVFKMFGNQSNILCYTSGNDHPTKIFKGQIKQDYSKSFSSLDRQINQTKSDFEETENPVGELFPTFGDIPKRYSTLSGWNEIQKVTALLESPKYYIVEDKGRIRLSLLEIGEVLSEFSTDDPVNAINQFYQKRAGSYYFEKEKGRLIGSIQKQLKQTANYISELKKRLDKIEHGQSLEEIGHILMANLHQIKEGEEKVELHNFYTDKTIVIHLKSRLSPQKNAERFYRKSKNQKIEIKVLKENLESAQKRSEVLNSQLSELNVIEDYKMLRTLSFFKKESKQIENASAHARFKTFDFQGFRIYVGRNSKNNDELTQKEAFKDDLWLHAKDVSGSHVIIKFQSGKTFPKSVVERAAEVAAFYSKRKNDTLCPVIVTPKKFVRKVKGAPAGAVVVDREDVVMVSPRDIN